MKLQVGVKAFLKNQAGKYLLVRRSLEKYEDVDGVWDIVGGRIDPGSTLLENLKREVKEETQLEIASDPQLLYAQDILLEKRHIVRLSFIAEVEDKNVVLDKHENVEYKWVTVDMMKQQDDLDKYVKEVIGKNLVS